MRPRRAAGLALATVLVATGFAGGGAAREPRLDCGSGTTMFVDGRLRIFAVPFGGGGRGAGAHACLGRRDRPAAVGLTYDDGGTGSDRTPAFAFGGGHHVARYHVSDGEGGPSASFSVTDLRTRRTVVHENVPCCEGIPRFLVASDGSLITGGDALRVHAPGRRPRKLSAPGTDAGEPAVVGSTLYWTEYVQGHAIGPRSATLAGVTTAREAVMLEPAFVRSGRRDCAAAGGTTIVASPSVRVFESAAGGSPGRVACRGGVRVAAGSTDAPRPRIAGDRWLLLLGPRDPATHLAVLDMRSGERVISAASGIGAGIVRATLLRDGTAAWREESGRVTAERPDGRRPVRLARAGEPTSALAGARRTVYWTLGDELRSASFDR